MKQKIAIVGCLAGIYLLVNVAMVLLMARPWPFPEARYLTTRPLPMNHRIVASDIKQDWRWRRFLYPEFGSVADFVGKYVPVETKERVPIDKDCMNDNPVLSGATNVVWVQQAQFTDADQSLADAGSTAAVCSGSEPCPTVKLLAKWCDEKQQCAFAVHASDSVQRDRLAAALDSASPAPRVHLHLYLDYVAPTSQQGGASSHSTGNPSPAPSTCPPSPTDPHSGPSQSNG